MIKKILASIAAMSLLSSVPVMASAESIPEATVVDAVSSASVKDYYSDFAISGDELMDAVNSFTGFYAVSTVNEDATPNIGYFIYSMVKADDEYYVTLGIEENQTRVNLERTGKAVAMYAVRPDDNTQPQYAVSGARMELELVTDEQLIEQLNTSGYESTMFCKVTSVRSLG